MVILVYFVALGAVASAAALAVLDAYWMLRPNRSRVDPELELATWNAVGSIVGAVPSAGSSIPNPINALKKLLP